jgi:transcriptional regulator NrdR family protein
VYRNFREAKDFEMFLDKLSEDDEKPLEPPKLLK